MQGISLIGLRRRSLAARLVIALALAPLVILGALYGSFALFHSAAELEGLFADPGDPHAIIYLAHRMTVIAGGYVVAFLHRITSGRGSGRLLAGALGRCIGNPRPLSRVAECCSSRRSTRAPTRTRS